MPRYLRARDVFSNEEIRELTARSDLRGAWAIATTWMVIAACFAAVAYLRHPAVWLLAIVIVGGRQLALAILMHEASHRTLFATRWFNDVLTDWLCARPIWNDVSRYREHHMRHHAKTNREGDPDRSLSEPFPTTPRSMWRKLLRDVSGVTGLKRILGHVMMDFGVLRYTVASDVERRPRDGRRFGDYLREGIPHVAPVLITNGAIFGVLWAFGVPEVYLVWLIAYLTTFSLFVRIRSLAEHACTSEDGNPLTNTRTTRAGLLARMTVAPIRVNYHIEHHLLAAVPFYRLPRMHELLRQKGLIEAPPGYFDVLRIVTHRPASS